MPTVAFMGGGVNSTAGIEELTLLGEPIDLIIFSDTGGERPDTYAHIERFGKRLEKRGYPAITVVRHRRADGTEETLEQELVRLKNLPPVTFGYKTCSQKFKIQPADKFISEWQPAIDAWARGERVTKLIFYDSGEAHRVKDYGDERFILAYPLVEWGWDRDRREQELIKAGICPPGKSSCFFCPNMSEEEVLDLRDKYPDLLERALHMERLAKPELITIKGLARDYSWQQIIDYDRSQLALLPKRDRTQPCGCYDGD